ncbi:unnamed protein product [Symbiodinium microadriaticum]|nr:unnamed protein product [Symbiodinium sp. KB8]CAE7885446.1 unnamed protein product [Symbiodinium microadriaticum]
MLSIVCVVYYLAVADYHMVLLYEAVPGEGLFPEVTTASPPRNWQMEITNGEVATLQESGLSTTSIRRVEQLLAALDRHQEQGTGPEARWALSCLVARMESCAEALEALMEVFHRRLVPRGFLPVQRTPGTHHDRQRFYQWICQYNTLCVDAVARTMETPLQTDEVEDAQALDAGPPVSMEQPSSSSGPALTSLNRARSRSRTRGSSASSSSSSLATAEVTAEPAASVVDMEAEQMLQATLRGDPPVLPSWALPGLTPSELPGLWHEDSPVGVTSPVNEVAADASPSPLLSSTTSSTTRTWWQQIELVDMLTNTTSSASNTWQIVATLASTTSSTTSSWRPSWELGVWFQGEMLYWSNSTVWWTSSTTSTTSTSSSEMLWPGEVVRDTVNLQAILAGGVDRVQILQRLLERQRYLLHEQRLLNEALEELAFWLPHASAAIPFNAAGMEWTIWQSVQREAQFGSARSTSSTSRFALTPSFLLMPELPRSTEAVWQQFPPETPRSVIAGYRIVNLVQLHCFVIVPGKYVRRLRAVLMYRTLQIMFLVLLVLILNAVAVVLRMDPLRILLPLLLLARLRMVMLAIVALVLVWEILVVVW